MTLTPLVVRKAADPKFLLQKKIEKHFAAKHPEKWVPVYSRVTFSDAPYAEALAIGDEQEALMAKIMDIPNIETLWDSPEIEKKMLSLLDEFPIGNRK